MWSICAWTVTLRGCSIGAQFNLGGSFYLSYFRSSSLNATVKSFPYLQSYCKNKSGIFLWLTVYIQSSSHYRRCNSIMRRDS